MFADDALKTFAASFAVVAALSFGTSAIASSYSYHSAPPCYDKTVTVWTTIQRPVVDDITKYDHCGKPYQVKIVRYVKVRVPIQKQVKVCY